MNKLSTIKMMSEVCPGEIAGEKRLFGECSRWAIYPVWPEKGGDDFVWCIDDAEGNPTPETIFKGSEADATIKKQDLLADEYEEIKSAEWDFNGYDYDD